MAAAPQLRVSDLTGAKHAVRLVLGASETSVEKAIALAVGLQVGTFGLKNAEGVSTVMDSTLTGDWIAVLLLAQPATHGELF
jgi:hypothetical protein